MKQKHLTAVVLVAGATLLSACEKNGRYQLVVTPAHEAGGKYYQPLVSVLDTRTGMVYMREHRGGRMLTWDPANKALRVDSLEQTSK